MKAGAQIIKIDCWGFRATRRCCSDEEELAKLNGGRNDLSQSLSWWGRGEYWIEQEWQVQKCHDHAQKLTSLQTLFCEPLRLTQLLCCLKHLLDTLHSSLSPLSAMMFVLSLFCAEGLSMTSGHQFFEGQFCLHAWFLLTLKASIAYSCWQSSAPIQACFLYGRGSATRCSRVMLPTSQVAPIDRLQYDLLQVAINLEQNFCPW